MIIVEIAGHLGRDPEQRFTATGQKITSITVATNARRSGKDETVWWKVTVWGDRFDKMIPYLKKGSPIIVIGEMQPPQIYMDKEGRPQVSVELTAEIIKFSPFGKPDRPDQAGAPNQNANANSNAPYNSGHQNYNPGGNDRSSGSSAYNAPTAGGQQTLSGMGGNQDESGEDPLPF